MLIPTSHFLDLGYTQATAISAPVHAASVVLVATRPIPSKSMADNVLPGLNPYQPNHRMTAPRAARVMLCPGGIPPPSRLNFRPSLGPRAMAPQMASTPPTVCTTVEPAKSRNGVVEPRSATPALPSQPSGPQIQCPKIG